MHNMKSPAGVTVSYEMGGNGPPLVLVHGSFSDHHTNWGRIKQSLMRQFTVYSVARRGRAVTAATEAHGVVDEGEDVAALIESIDEPVFLLGHSYGAQVALAATAVLPDRVRKLILYEPPWPHIIPQEQMAQLENLALVDDWVGLATVFFRDMLAVQVEELETLHATEPWNEIVADAKASLGDIRALASYQFDPASFGNLRVPVMLQVGTESPRELYVTDALADVLPDVRIEELAGQAHEGMNTAPEQYVESVSRFLLPQR